MGGKGSAPAAPDYVGAATEQARASERATNTQNFANRPTINTPFGTQSWQTAATVDPASGQSVTQWTQNTTLAPELQAALNDQFAMQSGRSQLAGDFMSRVGQEYGQPFDWQNLPQRVQMTGPATLDTQMADYTPGLSTDVGQRGVVSGFNFGGPQMGVSSMNERVQGNVPQYALDAQFDPMTGGMRMATTASPVSTSFDPMTGGVQRGVQNMGLNSQFAPMTGDLSRGVQQQAVQRNLGVEDNPALPQVDANFRDNVAQSLMERMQPVHERQQQQLETQLANQGFGVGSEGYTRALADLQQRQAAERFNALDMAGQEAQRLFNMGMGSRQQAFQEDVTGGQFANAAAQQAFQQGLGASQFQNAATNQAFNQAMSAQQAGNQALGQQFGQNLQAANFGNQATQQAYQQALGATQAANAARGQEFQQGLAGNQFANQALNQAFSQNMAADQARNAALGQQFQQGLSAGQFGNAAANQAFQQALGAGQFGNQAQAQLFGQMMGQADLANRAGSQAFQQDLAAQQFRNQALGQAGALDLQRMQAQNAALSQQQGLQQNYANFQNALRQQAIAEQMQRRGMSLNEMNALLTGQQVQMPQMPTFNQAGRAETPQILNATQMGYDAALGAYNAQQAGANNLMGGLFSLGGAALSNPFMFSDRRLKSNIKRVGTHPIGVGIYDYTMLGYPQRGVIAQEVRKVRPDLVKRHANGYLMVNYGGL
jgi:hypothetical protein